MKLIYEKHPVSPERKAELMESGYKILDARFEPKDESEFDLDAMKRAEIVKYLEAHGVEKGDTKGVNVDVLRDNLKSIMLVG